MRLIFVGTRGNIDKVTRAHRRHSAMLVTDGLARLLVDCGADWLGRFAALQPSAIVLTHGHPDHAAGLSAGAPYPVYATAETWPLLRRYPIARRQIVPPRTPFDLGGVVFEAFPIEHSLRAPAVGYRIAGAGRTVFYVPDVAALRDADAALRGADLYVGDGACVTRSILRRRNGVLIGHAPISTQLDWCREHGLTRALFTHCGSQIVGADGRSLGALVRRLGSERGVTARIAHDGLELNLGVPGGGSGATSDHAEPVRRQAGGSAEEALRQASRSV
jgi:phosphoribosyl 1,2-cyclic phosphodiesterase